MEKNRLLYKGKPLVRCGDEIFYGEPGAKYVVNIKILSDKLVAGAEIADRVHVTLVDNCASSPRERAVKESDKNGLFAALDIGTIWLERASSEKK